MLSDERIEQITGASRNRASMWLATTAIARAIEAEVRQDDEALIRQMLEAAIAIYPHLNGLAVRSDEALALLQQQISAITAARARLEKAP